VCRRNQQAFDLGLTHAPLKASARCPEQQSVAIAFTGFSDTSNKSIDDIIGAAPRRVT